MKEEQISPEELKSIAIIISQIRNEILEKAYAI
jgi:hypothetical protein